MREGKWEPRRGVRRGVVRELAEEQRELKGGCTRKARTNRQRIDSATWYLVVPLKTYFRKLHLRLGPGP